MDKIKIEKIYNKDSDYNGGATISLKRDGFKELRILFGGNLDLYFNLINFENDPTFYIGIDNYALYQIFDTLYHDIMNGNVTSENYFDDPLSMFDDEEDLRKKEIRKEKYRLRALSIANSTGLIDEDSIVWISDDYPHDVAPYFKIDRLPNAYKITFLINTPDRKLYGDEKYALNDYKDGYTSVRIRNDGSTYHMFNVPFMKAYNALLEMELNEPQIHIAEYLLDKELESGKSLEHILTLKKDD